MVKTEISDKQLFLDTVPVLKNIICEGIIAWALIDMLFEMFLGRVFESANPYIRAHRIGICGEFRRAGKLYLAPPC